MAKNAPFHIKSPVKNFHRRAKGGIAPCSPLNTPLAEVDFLGKGGPVRAAALEANAFWT